MRISTNSLAEALNAQLTNLTGQMYTLQNRVATGLQFTRLDQNPTGMNAVLNLQAESSQNAQYGKNITALTQTLTSSYNAMNSLQSLVQQANQIATEADGTATPQQLATYATQITQIIQQAAQIMNSRNENGEYLFGGTVTNQPPYVVTTNSGGQVTAVAYQGNSSVPSVEIAAGETVSAQVPGSNTSGTGAGGLITDSRSGADLFNHLIALQNDLSAGNVTAVASTDLPALSKDEDNVTTQISTNGIVQAQLNAASSLDSTKSTSIDGMISQDAGADVAKTLTELAAAQSAFQAALQSGSTLLNQNQSLLYYLG